MSKSFTLTIQTTGTVVLSDDYCYSIEKLIQQGIEKGVSTGAFKAIEIEYQKNGIEGALMMSIRSGIRETMLEEIRHNFDGEFGLKTAPAKITMTAKQSKGE